MWHKIPCEASHQQWLWWLNYNITIPKILSKTVSFPMVCMLGRCSHKPGVSLKIWQTRAPRKVNLIFMLIQTIVLVIPRKSTSDIIIHQFQSSATMTLTFKINCLISRSLKLPVCGIGLSRYLDLSSIKSLDISSCSFVLCCYLFNYSVFTLFTLTRL
jgi:hypothetical protein